MLGVGIPALIIGIMYLAKTQAWPFNGAQAKRTFASDYESLVRVRRIELESIIRGNVLSILNTLIYPYIRLNYIAKISDDLKPVRYKLAQSASRIMKYAINEIFYEALLKNGFKDLTDTDLVTYCWTKAVYVISAVDDCCCRYIDDDFMSMGVFDQEKPECKALLQSIYEVVGKPYDPSNPSRTGIVPQIILHESRTRDKTEELFTDPFLLYNMKKKKA